MTYCVSRCSCFGVLFLCSIVYFVDGMLVTSNVPKICYTLYVLCFMLLSINHTVVYSCILIITGVLVAGVGELQTFCGVCLLYTMVRVYVLPSGVRVEFT